MLTDHSVAAAVRAGIADDLSRSAAGVAGHGALKRHSAEPLRHSALAGAAAGLADGRFSVLRARALAGRAADDAVDFDFLFGTERGFLKGDRHRKADVLALTRGVGAGSAAASEETAGAADHIRRQSHR